LPELPIDEALLDALETGLPDCAGVAVGVDRLIALLTGAGHLAEPLV
jgi:lysyl-tRNA synthetase class 2